MKVKELQEILQNMNPDDELRLYCGGESFYEDHSLSGVEYFDDTGFICFNLTDDGKYGIANQVDMEDFENDIDCLGGNFLSIDYAEREKLRLAVKDALANDDTYNTIYNKTLQEVITKECPKIFDEVK